MAVLPLAGQINVFVGTDWTFPGDYYPSDAYPAQPHATLTRAHAAAGAVSVSVAIGGPLWPPFFPGDDEILGQSAELDRSLSLAGTAAVTVTVTGSVVNAESYVGQSDVVTAVPDAIITVARSLAGAVTVTTGLSDAWLDRSLSLAGTIDASFTVVGDLPPWLRLEGTVAATIVVGGLGLDRSVPLAGTVAVTVMGTATLTRTHQVFGQISVFIGTDWMFPGDYYPSDVYPAQPHATLSRSVSLAGTVTGTVTFEGLGACDRGVVGLSELAVLFADALLEAFSEIAGSLSIAITVSNPYLRPLPKMIVVVWHDQPQITVAMPQRAIMTVGMPDRRALELCPQ